jgi:phospholipase D1/2
MTTAGPADGGSNPEHLKDKIEEKIKHPFSGLREKLRDTKLYDVKVGLIHKKYACSTYLQGFRC